MQLDPNTTSFYYLMTSAAFMTIATVYFIGQGNSRAKTVSIVLVTVCIIALNPKQSMYLFLLIPSLAVRFISHTTSIDAWSVIKSIR